MKYREIERLRGLAIMMTMWTHLELHLLPLLVNQTWAGVDLFFVISGFVVTLSLLRSLPELPEQSTFIDRVRLAKQPLTIFFTKRVYRIAPLAIFVALTSSTLAFLRHGDLLNICNELVGIASGIYNYTVAAGYHPTSLFFYWSLAVEEHFYFLLPVLLVALPTLNSRVRATLIAIACVVFVLRPLNNIFIGVSPSWLQSRALTHVRIDALLAGTAIALATQIFGVNKMKLHWRWQIIACLSMVVLWTLPSFVVGREGHTPTFLFVSLWIASGILVYFASADAGIILNIPALAKLLEYLGSRSYALYLCHFLSFQAADKIIREIGDPIPNGPVRETLRSILSVAVAIIVAEILHRFIEKPFIAMGQRRIEAFKRADETKTSSTLSDSKNHAA